MARILEALRPKESSNLAAMTFPAPELALSPPPVSEIAPKTGGDAVHFIEVGGARIEASPEVLRSGTAAAPLPAPREQPMASPAAVPSCHAAPAQAEAGDVAFEGVPNPLTVAMSRQRFAPELIALHDPDHPIAREYQRLLDCMLAHAPAQKPAVFMLCGCGEQVGTTTAVLNLAITLARRDCRTAVVDACAGRPAVAGRLGMPPVPGLSEVCTGQVALGRALRKSGQPHLLVLTAGDEAAGPSLAVRSLPAVLGQLRRRGDFVFVDAPAWRDAPEMASLAEACDALFLVAPHAQYATPEFAELLRRLPRQGVRLGGCVLTHRTGR